MPKFQPGQSGNPDQQFKKGQSGNPGGRPRGLAERMREFAQEGVVIEQQITRFLAMTKRPDLQFRAMEFLADRGWGKPALTQKVTHGFQPIIIQHGDDAPSDALTHDTPASHDSSDEG